MTLSDANMATRDINGRIENSYLRFIYTTNNLLGLPRMMLKSRHRSRCVVYLRVFLFICVYFSLFTRRTMGCLITTSTMGIDEQQIIMIMECGVVE